MQKDTVEIFYIEPQFIGYYDGDDGKARLHLMPFSEESQLPVHSGAMVTYGKTSGRDFYLRQSRQV